MKKGVTEQIDIKFPPKGETDVELRKRRRMFLDIVEKMPSVDFPAIPKVDFKKVLYYRQTGRVLNEVETFESILRNRTFKH